MYTKILLVHSIIRLIMFVLLVMVTGLSLSGWVNKKPYTNIEDKSSLLLLITGHLQLLFGLALYFISPRVIFEAASMKDDLSRYWLVEHISLMLAAIALITIGRIKSKKLADEIVRHRTLFIFTAIAFFLMIVSILLSGRPLFEISNQAY